MAKFAIALCILLIAITFGDEDSNSWGIMGNLTSTLTSYGTDGQTGIKTMLESIADATNASAAFDNLVNSTMESATAQYEEIIASLSSNGTGNASSCTSLGIDSENLASQVVSNTIDCVYETLADILSDSNTTVAEFTKSISALNDMAGNATSCTSNNSSASSCITSIWTSVTGDVASSWAKLLADAAILTTKFSSLQVSMGSCGLVGITKTLANQTQASYSEIQKCIDDSNSTGS